MASGASYNQELEDVISQAAIHLHNSAGAIGTALITANGTIIFSNNALTYTDRETLIHLAMNCLEQKTLLQITRCVIGNLTAFATSLDAEHVFVVIGKHIQEQVVERFLASLGDVLPEQWA